VASRCDAARRFIIEERYSDMNTLKTIFTRPVLAASSRPSRLTRIAMVAIAGVLGTVLSVSSASAYTCVRGVYRAGCISQYGAVGWSRNGAVAVGRYGNVYAYHRGSSCVWRNGQRVCL
jgi:hypothetical protein